MKIAVLSDIHSNYHAFKACFSDALNHGADTFIFLGDYVSDLACPQQTLDLLYEIRSNYPTVCIRGNREGYMLNHESGSAAFSKEDGTGSLLFTFENLRKKDLDFFRTLKISDTVKLDGVDIEIAHASKDDDRRGFTDTEGNIEEIVSQMKCKYLLTGHSHKQYIYRSRGKTVINPGSAGVPQHGTPWPKYALMEVQNGEISCELRQVKYDIEEVIRAQFESGLADYAPHWAAGILYNIMSGEDYVIRLLNRANKTDSPAELSSWLRAANEIGIKLTKGEIMDEYKKRFSPDYESLSKNTVASVDQLKNDTHIRFDGIEKSGVRVMFLGNSITLHGVRPEVGWFYDWGMAASAEEKDYVHILKKKIRELRPDAAFCVCQGADWETNYKSGSEVLSKYSKARDFGADIIVMRLIENCSAHKFDPDLFKAELSRLLSYLAPEDKAQIILTTGFWRHPGDEAIVSYGKENSLPLVPLGDLGDRDEYKAIGLFEHDGVANHPCDKGMSAIAERIFAELKKYI